MIDHCKTLSLLQISVITSVVENVTKPVLSRRQYLTYLVLQHSITTIRRYLNNVFVAADRYQCEKWMISERCRAKAKPRLLIEITLDVLRRSLLLGSKVHFQNAGMETVLLS